ncbi:hypothetical protein [Pendulispora albinea]|uniref:DUF4229 domain-containing protein n=1 Tax=Pendulispora albinea TaxID=2741071 RepID=A0ABZ2LPI8_9BACT
MITKALFIAFLVVTLIAFGGMLAFAMGMALVALLPAAVLLGPPFFLLWRVQKQEQLAADQAMRAADLERSVLKG